MDFIDKFKSVLPEEINFDELYELAPADLWKTDPRKAGVIALDRLGIFDKDYYLEKYRDVGNSGIDAVDHWIRYGVDEGRIAIFKKTEKKEPKISIIIPVFNKQNYLNDCINSILKQSLKDIEIIFIDDGSTDNSLKIIEYYKLKDPRIKIIVQKNSGAAIARTNGMKIAHGEYIGFVDADDYIEKNFYLKLYIEAKKYNADLVRGLYFKDINGLIIEEQLNSVIREKYNKNIPLNVNDHSVVIWNAIYKTKYLRDNKIDYFDDISSTHDVPFTARATYFSKKSVPALAKYYYKINIKGQLIELSKKRFFNFILSSKITQEFIASHSYNTENDKLIAYKRCIDRYEYI